MTALSDIKSIPDLINFIWERDKDYDWVLSQNEAPDIGKNQFESMSSDPDKRLLRGEDIAKYRDIPISVIPSSFLPRTRILDKPIGERPGLLGVLCILNEREFAL